jgi:hypothetical protein
VVAASLGNKTKWTHCVSEPKNFTTNVVYKLNIHFIHDTIKMRLTEFDKVKYNPTGTP